MNKSIFLDIAKALRRGENVELSIEDFPCFGPAAAQQDIRFSADRLQEISLGLTQDDAQVFERAARAIDEKDMAWLGFKIVDDFDMAAINTQPSALKKYGDQGSACRDSFVYFCNDNREIICAHPYSERDFFQMKDATRGPSMHTTQFPGLTWTSIPLFDPVRLWLIGGSDVAVETAKLACHVGFDVVVVDEDDTYITPERFPETERILLDSLEDLSSLRASEGDFICILTRGHVYDAEGCIWAVSQPAAFISMMGRKVKNKRIYKACMDGGMTQAQWESIKLPIGFKFGAVSPAELSISIVAELVDRRYKIRYSQAAQDKHNDDVW